MTDVGAHTDLCRQLRYLLDAGTLAQEQRKTGERVLNRLSSDIRIALLGPETAGKDYLQEVMAARAIPRTSVRLVAQGCAFDFQDADICLWLTTGFAPDEANQWQAAPDRLKDHSFLVPVANKDTAAALFATAQLEALSDIAAEEFHGVFPLVIGPAATDQQTNMTEVVLREVANIVRLGVLADADNAQMFLKRHQPKGAAGRSAHAETLSPSLIDAPLSANALSARDTPSACNEGTEVCRKALATLRSRVCDLEPLMSASEDADFRRILSICEETSTAVADVFSDGPLRDPAFVAIREEMLSAADKILLMTFEGGVEPAVAAVTTILQIRREMEVQIAC